MKIASKFGDEVSTTSETIDEVTKENETEDEKSSKLVVNMITTTKETQVVDPKQNQLTDHDLSNVSHDPKVVDRDPDIKYHETRLRERPHKVIDSKDGGMSTEEHESGTYGNSIFYYESGELYSKDEGQHMAVLPEVASSTT